MDCGPEPDTLARLPWPLFTIDFEASALGPLSYPIEIGICRWLAPGAPLQVWSALIRPASEWSNERHWDPVSARVHGIPQESLEAGLTPTAAVAAANRFIAGMPDAKPILYCDGGAHDLHWARTLAAASKAKPFFRLGDFDYLTGSLHQLQYMRMVRWHDRASVRHRAGDDAERLLKGLARGLKVQHGPVHYISTREIT